MNHGQAIALAALTEGIAPHLVVLAAAPEPTKRKAKRKSPTQRTLEHLRGNGYPLVQVVEKWNPHARIRQDLFGIIDVLAVSEIDIIAVQSTSGANVAKRIAKLAESEALPVLLKAGIRVVVHGWRKNAAGRWVLREVEL
jgi:hypothetical protein